MSIGPPRRLEGQVLTREDHVRVGAHSGLVVGVDLLPSTADAVGRGDLEQRVALLDDVAAAASAVRRSGRRRLVTAGAGAGARLLRSTLRRRGRAARRVTGHAGLLRADRPGTPALSGEHLVGD